MMTTLPGSHSVMNTRIFRRDKSSAGKFRRDRAR
jgi:hypothetical protein